MTKPIALLDNSFLAKLYNNRGNISIGDAIARISQLYDVRLTGPIRFEIENGPAYTTPEVKTWIDSLPIIDTPVSDGLFTGGAVGRANLGDLSILEAAGELGGNPVVLSNDDKFFGRISRGEIGPLVYVTNQNTPAYQLIADDFHSIFPSEKAAGYTRSIDLLARDYDAGLISKSAYVESTRIFLNLPSAADFATLAQKLGNALGKSIDPSDLVIGIATLVVASMLPGDAFARELESQANDLGIGVAVTLFALGMVLAFPGSATFITAVLFAAGVAGMVYAVDYLMDLFKEAFPGLWDNLTSPLLHLIRDPLILDLDGDGIELSALAGSNVHFDYDGDGFAERTGWVSADDGILVIDRNGNGAEFR